MVFQDSFHFRFSGITVRFILPAPTVLTEEFTSFLCDASIAPDVEYEIELLTEPLVPAVPPFHIHDGTMIYRLEKGWLRVYPMRKAEDGCQVACLLRPNGKHTLFYPASMWDYYSRPLRCMPHLGLEIPLLQSSAFLLHSSVVQIHGKAVLFSGPSGAGKSTQANLWETHLGARILNGDRCVIQKRPDGFYGGGSPLAGSSRIYCPDQFPIAGIFLVCQSGENQVRQLGFEAFSPLFSQTLVNSWDTAFMDKITALFQDLLQQVPVYRLDCRPDEDAVYLAYKTLF